MPDACTEADLDSGLTQYIQDHPEWFTYRTGYTVSYADPKQAKEDVTDTPFTMTYVIAALGAIITVLMAVGLVIHFTSIGNVSEEEELEERKGPLARLFLNFSPVYNIYNLC